MKNKKYSVYLTKDESDLLHEIVTHYALKGEKASYSEILSQSLLLLYDTLQFAGSKSLCKDVRVIESNLSDEEN